MKQIKKKVWIITNRKGDIDVRMFWTKKAACETYAFIYKSSDYYAVIPATLTFSIPSKKK